MGLDGGLAELGQPLQDDPCLLRIALESAQGGIAVLDRDLRVIRTNRWMEKRHADRMPLVGSQCHRAFRLRAEPCPQCPCLPAMETGEASTAIVPHPTPEQPDGWAKVSAFPLRRDDGQVIGVLEYVQDAGAPAPAADSRRHSEELMLIRLLNQAANRGDSLHDLVQLLARETRRLFSGVRAAVYLLTEDRRSLIMQSLQLSSAMAQRLEAAFGAAFPQLQISLQDAGCLRQLLQEGKPRLLDDPAEIRAVMAQLSLARPVPQSMPAAGRRLIPEIYSLLPANSLMILPLLTDGRAIGLLEVSRAEPFTDQDLQRLATDGEHVAPIIRRKQAEEALRAYSIQLQTTLERSTADLELAQERLVRQERLALLGQLAGGVAHELRGPLSVLSNAAHLLRMIIDDATPDVSEVLGILDREVTRSVRVIDTLLGFAQPKAPLPQPVDVGQLVDEALARLVRSEAVEVETCFQDPRPMAWLDSDQLALVLDNLLRNALQAMPSGGKLTVLVREAEPADAPDELPPLLVSVCDTGVGISPECVNRIFEPLYTTKAKGLGLGLALSKHLVEINGGTIAVESQVWGGSKFTLRLPAAPLPRNGWGPAQVRRA